MSNKYGGLNNNTIKNWYPPPSPFFCFWTAPGIHHFQEIWPKQHLQSCLNWTVFTHRTLWVTGLFLSTWVTFWSSRTWEEHIHHTQAELQHLQETYVKAEKWECYTSTVSFLGYIVAEGNLEIDPVKVSAISTWTMPENWKLVQHFLSFSTVVSFRTIAPWQLPLLYLTSAKVSFWWISLSREGFLTLKAHSCPLPSSRCLTLS